MKNDKFKKGTHPTATKADKRTSVNRKEQLARRKKERTK